MSESPLELLINGEPRPMTPGLTVAGLVEGLGLEPRKIAIAVNRSVVPRSTFATHTLTSGDRVEILEAVGGG